MGNRLNLKGHGDWILRELDLTGIHNKII